MSDKESNLIPEPVEAAVYRKLHERRADWIEEKRRARDYQAQLENAKKTPKTYGWPNWWC